MNKLVFGEVKNGRGDIPVMNVSVVNTETNEVVSQGFLSPFRAYCFQVSGTETGEIDLGASQVIGLKRIMTAEFASPMSFAGYQSNVDDEGIRYELLKGQIYIALMKFCAGVEVDVTISWEQNKILRDYINDVMAWLKTI